MPCWTAFIQFFTQKIREIECFFTQNIRAVSQCFTQNIREIVQRAPQKIREKREKIPQNIREHSDGYGSRPLKTYGKIFWFWLDSPQNIRELILRGWNVLLDEIHPLFPSEYTGVPKCPPLRKYGLSEVQSGVLNHRLECSWTMSQSTNTGLHKILPIEPTGNHGICQFCSLLKLKVLHNT